MTAAVNIVSEVSPSPIDAPSRLHGAAYWAVIVLRLTGLLMSINQTFTLRVLGFDPMGNSFLYYLIGVYLAAAFLIYPATKGAVSAAPWYDWLLGVIAIGTTIYLGLNGLMIIEQGWDFSAPIEATLVCAALLLLIVEGIRRCGGTPLLIVVLLFGCHWYPHAGGCKSCDWLCGVWRGFDGNGRGRLFYACLCGLDGFFTGWASKSGRGIKRAHG